MISEGEETPLENLLPAYAELCLNTEFRIWTQIFGVNLISVNSEFGS